MSAAIKLSSRATREFWEIPVLFEDEQLLALNKPAGLLTSPDRDDPNRPNLMKLLRAGIAAAKPWTRERNLDYLSNAHRLDFETSGIILLAKNKSTLIALANLFSSGKAQKKYLALVRGEPMENQFAVDAKLAPHPVQTGLMRINPKNGRQSETKFEVLENFPRFGYALLKCEPLTERPHQIRVHLQYAGLKIVGDELYGGKPLWLSRLKSDYRLKPGREERPLISRAALHAEELILPHPATNETVTIKSEWPKDLNVAVKYLRQFSK
ncbi:MAG: RluA family pseudouridine synthase [Limisphaerales bacterium]